MDFSGSRHGSIDGGGLSCIDANQPDAFDLPSENLDLIQKQVLFFDFSSEKNINFFDALVLKKYAKGSDSVDCHVT
jgi:hypothetical protein